MKPIKIFSDSIEDLALQQFNDAMAQPYSICGALMPDAHAGYAMPIGGVIATEGVIVPSWIGFDIGCGMCAVRTDFEADDIREHAKEIYDQIYLDIPVGFNHNKTPVAHEFSCIPTAVGKSILESGGRNQLGTLGSGNHFIEIGVDENGYSWIVIHSGSRNVGHRIATHYMKVASGDGKAREGHYALSVDSQDGKGYLQDLAFGLEFALANRMEMVRRVELAMSKCIAGNIDISTLINRNHNHAELKHMPHNGPTRELRPYWIHRKGATHAENGMMGVIPGNMRDGSFIVRGKGNPDSLYSSSHGAGRVMGRKEAKAKLDINSFTETMNECNIQANVSLDTLDEAPDAYKNIFDVMAMQSDLVEIVHHIKPLINIKG